MFGCSIWRSLPAVLLVCFSFCIDPFKSGHKKIQTFQVLVNHFPSYYQANCKQLLDIWRFMATKLNVFSASHLTVKAKSKAAENKELTSRLKALHVALSLLTQNEEERENLKNLKTIAGQLVSKRLLAHLEKDIRALACCCIVDILRIFVPESPFRYEHIYDSACVTLSYLFFFVAVVVAVAVRRNYVKFLVQSLNSFEASARML